MHFLVHNAVWKQPCLHTADEASAHLLKSVVAVGAGMSCCAPKRVPPGSLHLQDHAAKGMPSLAQQRQLEGESAEATARYYEESSSWNTGKGLPRLGWPCPGKLSSFYID